MKKTKLHKTKIIDNIQCQGDCQQVGTLHVGRYRLVQPFGG